MRYVVRAELRLPAPADAVWAVLRDPARWPEWDPYIVELRQIEGDPARPWQPGARWRERVRRGPFRPTFHLTAVGAEPGEVGWRARYLFVSATHRWRTRPQGQGTVVESEEVFEGWTPIVAIAARFLRLFRVAAMAQASLRALGEVVQRESEGQTQPGAPPPRAGQEADRASE